MVIYASIFCMYDNIYLKLWIKEILSVCCGLIYNTELRILYFYNKPFQNDFEPNIIQKRQYKLLPIFLLYRKVFLKLSLVLTVPLMIYIHIFTTIGWRLFLSIADIQTTDCICIYSYIDKLNPTREHGNKK